MFGEIDVPLSDSYELYLEFDEDDLSCGYYIVDHSKRCIFWLEPVSTEDVGMNPAFSMEHLRECQTSFTALEIAAYLMPCVPRVRLWAGRDVLVTCRVLSIPRRDPSGRRRG